MCKFIHYSFNQCYYTTDIKCQIARYYRTCKLYCICVDFCFRLTGVMSFTAINTLNAELNAICYLLALLGAHHFLHVSRIRVKLINLFLKNMSRIFRFNRKRAGITGTLYKDIYTFIISYWILLRVRNVSDKNCRENQNTNFIFNRIF